MPTIVNNGDAEMMFLGSVVEQNGDLLAIHRLEGGNMMSAYSFNQDKMINVLQDADTLLSPTSWQLGYFQLDSVARFLQRGPARQYRVGWSDRNINNFPSVAKIVASKNVRAALRRMIHKEYPTFESAYESARRNDSCVAFDRQMAVAYTGEILFKGNSVAVVVDTGKVRFRDKWQFLQAELEKICER